MNIVYVVQYAEHTLPMNRGLYQRVIAALEYYPCDIIFVHRDAERESYDFRLNEITQELTNINIPYVPIIPIRMTEAWLLFDELAIRKAVGNENGTTQLNLPQLRTLETIPNPKEKLYEALKLAAELPRRRAAKFHPQKYRHRVAELVTSFEPLRAINGFSELERNISVVFEKLCQ